MVRCAAEGAESARPPNYSIACVSARETLIASKPSSKSACYCRISNTPWLCRCLRTSRWLVLPRGLGTFGFLAIEHPPRDHGNDILGRLFGLLRRDIDPGFTRASRMITRQVLGRSGRSWPYCRRSWRCALAKVTEMRMCDQAISASISTYRQAPGRAYLAFARRRLDEPFPYVLGDAAIREGARQRGIASQAVLIAPASTAKGGARCWRWSWHNRRKHIVVEGVSSQPQGRPVGRRVRRLRRSPGSQEGDRRALPEASGSVATCTFSEMPWTTCRENADDCLQELRWL